MTEWESARRLGNLLLEETQGDGERGARREGSGEATARTVRWTSVSRCASERNWKHPWHRWGVQGLVVHGCGKSGTRCAIQWHRAVTDAMARRSGRWRIMKVAWDTGRAAKVENIGCGFPREPRVGKVRDDFGRIPVVDPQPHSMPCDLQGAKLRCDWDGRRWSWQSQCWPDQGASPWKWVNRGWLNLECWERLWIELRNRGEETMNDGAGFWAKGLATTWEGRSGFPEAWKPGSDLGHDV